MVPQEGTVADPDALSAVPPAVAEAALRYQRFREVEKEHLDRMGRYNLLDDWTEEVRATVIEARERIREVRAARELFRQKICEFVNRLRATGEPLSMVLRQTRSLLRVLELAGAIVGDYGWLEAEVLEWAIEEYENAA